MHNKIVDNYFVIQYSEINYFALQGTCGNRGENVSLRSQLLKGVLDGCVLALIEKEEVYGYELSKKLQQYCLDVSEGTIYPILLRLQKNKWIVGTMRPSESGPNRKYYSITTEGQEALQTIREEWEMLATPITNILRGDENGINYKGND